MKHIIFAALFLVSCKGEPEPAKVVEKPDPGAADRATLASLTDAQLVMWNSGRVSQLFGQGKRAPRGEGCPEVERLRDLKPKDEFERRDLEAKLTPAIEACKATQLEQFTREIGNIAVVEVAVRANEYNFQKTVFPLCLSDSTNQSPTPYLKLRSVLKTEQLKGLLLSAEGAPIGIKTKGLGDISLGDNCSPLVMPEAEARTLSSRLKAANSHLRMQIAFKPRGWGATGWTVTYAHLYDGLPQNIEGLLGEGIGYRIVDDAGVIRPWTPFQM